MKRLIKKWLDIKTVDIHTTYRSDFINGEEVVEEDSSQTQWETNHDLFTRYRGMVADIKELTKDVDALKSILQELWNLVDDEEEKKVKKAKKKKITKTKK